MEIGYLDREIGSLDREIGSLDRESIKGLRFLDGETGYRYFVRIW